MFEFLANALIKCPPFKGRLRLLRHALRKIDGGVVNSRYGVNFRVHAQDFTNWACISGAYGRDYDDVFEITSGLKGGEAFVDIGANAGLFSMVAGKKVGPTGVVLSFEPNEKVFSQLIDNAKLNGLSNIYAQRAAVGNVEGTIRFRAGGDDHTGVGRLDEAGETEVRVVTFHDHKLIEALGDREVTVKIDVEGAEALVVEGLRPLLATQRVRAVVVEIDEENLSSFGSSSSEIYETMGAYGFQAQKGKNFSAHFNEIFVR